MAESKFYENFNENFCRYSETLLSLLSQGLSLALSSYCLSKPVQEAVFHLFFAMIILLRLLQLGQWVDIDPSSLEISVIDDDLGSHFPLTRAMAFTVESEMRLAGPKKWTIRELLGIHAGKFRIGKSGSAQTENRFIRFRPFTRPLSVQLQLINDNRRGRNEVGGAKGQLTCTRELSEVFHYHYSAPKCSFILGSPDVFSSQNVPTFISFKTSQRSGAG